MSIKSPSLDRVETDYPSSRHEEEYRGSIANRNQVQQTETNDQSLLSCANANGQQRHVTLVKMKSQATDCQIFDEHLSYKGQVQEISSIEDHIHNPCHSCVNSDIFAGEHYPVNVNSPSLSLHASIEVNSLGLNSSIPLAEAVAIPIYDIRICESVNIVRLDQDVCIIEDPSPMHEYDSNGILTTSDTSIHDCEVNTDTNEIESNTRTNDAKMKEIVQSTFRNEHRFWIKFVAFTILLNVLLVAGVVVAGFCITGFCVSTNDHYIPYEERTLPPTLIGSIIEDPYRDNLVGGKVESITTASPLADPTSENDPVVTVKKSNSHSIRILISVAIMIELLIVAFLVCYYRRWKRTKEISRTSSKINERTNMKKDVSAT